MNIFCWIIIISNDFKPWLRFEIYRRRSDAVVCGGGIWCDKDAEGADRFSPQDDRFTLCRCACIHVCALCLDYKLPTSLFRPRRLSGKRYGFYETGIRIIIEAVAESPFPPTISACPTDGVLIPLGQAI